MSFLEKHKAFVITVLTVSIFTAGLLSLKFSSKGSLTNSIIYNLDFKEVEELDKIFEELKNPLESQEIETHRAFNEAEKATESDLTNRSTKESGKKKESSIDKSIDEQILEELANEPDLIAILDNNARVAKENRSKVLVPKPKKEKTSRGEDTSNDIAFENTANRNSSIYYHLLGRSVIDFPNPIYTCEKSGKIVVNIVVDNSGNVVETSLNKTNSTSSDWCLVENAFQYASRAFFNISDKPSQVGTITYIFPGQGRN